ncbi:hypothetical protein [Candidatus Halobonum tyrrellensis]|uniref:Uncharacterized protein n=1 Tax=Candidatus Halobonum tyrrellensis G22 TaxID=1324957 RepID=V4HHC7_9EURY|nr:hypothetical protein [Candidatus Halobonum tyrrellensis]ESP87274.1 hypothetical protein K933_14348 [Candidatus Halobonum tyrrellensis G22]
MVTVIDFLTQLGLSVVELLRIFLVNVAFNSVLGFVAFLTGALFVGVSIAVFGYLTLGAVASLFGFGSSASNRPPTAGRPTGESEEH